MEDFVYNDIIGKISSAFENQMDNIEAEYNFDYGHEFEINVCKFLRNFLPLKYGVCRGFVVDKYGNKAGDDIIIYDQEQYPTLRILGQSNTFEQKEQIPVEAVYAYIEAKYTLTEESLKKAMAQVAKVKELCYTREPIYVKGIDTSQEIFDNCYAEKIDWLPIITNPVYGMILSAKCNIGENHEEITGGITKIINSMGKEIENNGYYNFDSIAASKSNTVFGALRLPYENNIKEALLITKFYTGINGKATYQVNAHENKSYGLVLAHFMAALNIIQLGAMPWSMIFNTAKIPDKEQREKIRDIIEGR